MRAKLYSRPDAAHPWGYASVPKGTSVIIINIARTGRPVLTCYLANPNSITADGDCDFHAADHAYLGREEIQ